MSNEEKKPTVFKNTLQCSNSAGIPFDVLVAASVHKDSPKGTLGFHESGRIHWDSPDANGNTLEKWVREHLEELSTVDGEDIETWNLREKRAKALLAEFKLLEMRGEVVSKQTVKDLLDRIANAQVSLINGKIRQELPARFKLTPDQIQQLEQMLNEVFAVMQKSIEAWSKR